MTEPELLKSVPLKRQRKISSNKFTVVKNPLEAEGISECFHKISTSLYVSLAPAYTHDPIEGIKSQHLDPLLMTYFPAAGGVVLAYYNLRLFGNPSDEASDLPQKPLAAKIMYDSPFAFLWVSVDFLVWKPQPKDKIDGWVNIQSPSHIGLLIHGTFNATIKRDLIPFDWNFIPNQSDEEDELALTTLVNRVPADLLEEGKKPSNNDRDSLFRNPKSTGYWVDSHGIKIEGKLSFTIKSFNVSGQFVFVQGSLLSPTTVQKDLSKIRNFFHPSHKRNTTEEVSEDSAIIKDIDSAVLSGLSHANPSLYGCESEDKSD